MVFEHELHRIETSALTLTYFYVPWDSEIFAFPVAQIASLEVKDEVQARQDFLTFSAWLKAENIKLASCRLSHALRRESLFLEEMGFRFIEMVLHPHCPDVRDLHLIDQGLSVQLARAEDLNAIEAIAERAFTCERFHVDPRLDPSKADRRYKIWARNSFEHAQQCLYKIMDNHTLVGFFVTENKSPTHSYWHLTAIAPQLQGLGYGKRVWLSMLRHQQQEGISEISTTISASNFKVLSLYASLGFRFLPPQMTLHWVS